MLDILGKRYLFFGISFLLIVPGFIILAIWGLPLAIDFVGGSMLEIQFDSGIAPQPATIYEIINDMGVTDVKVQTTGDDVLVIRTPELSAAIQTQIIEKIESATNDSLTILRSETVGPTIGEEVTGRAAIAIAVAALGVVLYIGFAFRGIPNAWRYGACAIVATVHDILIIVSLAAIGSHFWGWQIDSMFLTALLTVIGFSTQDTIVVFDRIRENNNIHRKLEYEKLVNHSIVQTLQRSINTQVDDLRIPASVTGSFWWRYHA